MSNVEIILAVINTIVAILAGSAVPFAVSTASRLARIETTLQNGLRSDVTEIKANCSLRAPLYYALSERVVRLEEHLTKE